MNSFFPPHAALLAVCLLASAQAAPRPALMQIGELPGEKTPELLQNKERNPFTRHETKLAETMDDRESEESRLRTAFAAMSVTGVIRGGGTMKVLLGSVILKEGRPVPKILDGQTERLVVGPIDDTKVEINFVENDKHAEPRKIFIPIDLHPRVADCLPALPQIPPSDPRSSPARSSSSTSRSVQ